MGVLDSYHAALGELIGAAEGTLVRLTADELLVVFNDPLPCEEPAARAVRLAVALRDRVWELAEAWNRLGFELQLAAGVALGHATIGRIGSEHRWEYAPVGTGPDGGGAPVRERGGRADPDQPARLRGHRGPGDHAGGGGARAARLLQARAGLRPARPRRLAAAAAAATAAVAAAVGAPALAPALFDELERQANGQKTSISQTARLIGGDGSWSM